ncbi:MAG: hypothetical protein KBS35_00775 [Mycoplasma sp.]|nr:hypothetical protein [Candidatus Hennigella equi]
MVKIYHSNNLDAINWKIYTDNTKSVIEFLPTGTTPTNLIDKLGQVSLFDIGQEEKTYVVNIDGWKLTDETTKNCIRELHSLSTPIIFVYESATVKNKIFSELKVEVIKATSVTKKAKATLIHKLLIKVKIKLNPDVEELLVSLLPEKIHFIENEIEKLKLMNQPSFTKEEIKQIVFDLGDATVFNIVDSWLNGNQEQTIERLNDLISKNITIQAFVPIFALKLVQIKLFLSAKLARWSSEIITAKLGLPFWQQAIYNNMRPYDKNLDKIDAMLNRLYQFDINVKKQKNIPYTQLIKILFE